MALIADKVVGYVTYGIESLRLAEEDAKRVGLQGYINVCERIPCVIIHRLAVADDFRKLGIGSSFVDHVAAVAADLRDIMPCRLIIVDAYADAVEFYQRKGFEISSSTKTWLGSGALCSDEDQPEIIFMLVDLGSNDNTS